MVIAHFGAITGAGLVTGLGRSMVDVVQSRGACRGARAARHGVNNPHSTAGDIGLESGDVGFSAASKPTHPRNTYDSGLR